MTEEMQDGYVLDVDHPKTIHPKLSPVEIDFVLTQRGVALPEEPDGSKRYCHLGCGPGYTTVLLAAMDPETEYTGIDVNPRHVASGRDLAQRAGVENVRFLERSFEGAVAEELGPFDWIALDRVISWVSEAVEDQIGRFIEAFLRAGGRLYVSYNAMPGKNQMDPLRRMLQFFLHLESERSSLEDRADAALHQVQALFKRKAGVFTQNARLARAVQQLSNQPIERLIHEYLHEHWRSRYFMDVAKRYEALGLSYVGSTDFRENVGEYQFTVPVLSHLNTFRDPLTREQVADFYRNAAFRSDVYCSEMQLLSREERLAAWKETAFGLTVPPEKVNPELTIPAGKVSLDKPVFRAAVEGLKRGPRKLVDVEEESGHSTDDLIRMALMPLLATGQAKPMAAVPRRETAVKKLNAAVNRTALEEAALFIGALGTDCGVALPAALYEQAYLALRENGHGGTGEDVMAEVMRVLEKHDRRLTDPSGQPIQGEDEALARLRELLEEFEQGKQPLFERLGAL